MWRRCHAWRYRTRTNTFPLLLRLKICITNSWDTENREVEVNDWFNVEGHESSRWLGKFFLFLMTFFLFIYFFFLLTAWNFRGSVHWTFCKLSVCMYTISISFRSSSQSSVAESFPYLHLNLFFWGHVFFRHLAVRHFPSNCFLMSAPLNTYFPLYS